MLWCLAANLALCLGISGNVADSEYDPAAPLALQLKHVPDVPVDNVRWTNTCLLVDPNTRCMSSTDDRNVVLAPTNHSWTVSGSQIRFGQGLCLTVMECDRRDVPGSTNRTYCDSRVNTLNEMTSTQLASSTKRIRGSYVKLAKCSARIPTQYFVASDPFTSARPSYAPTSVPTSSAPSAAPSTSPSVSPIASRVPSLAPTSRPSSRVPSQTPSVAPSTRPSRIPTRGPTSVRPTTSSPAGSSGASQSTQGQETWWIGVLVGSLLIVGALASPFAYKAKYGTFPW